MQTETPPKQAALARQVRQRMNRLGKPEHRARFCFFSKKKSLAGMRRFPITLEIQIPMGFNCGTLNPCSPKNPSPITALSRRLRHRARRNHRRITPRHARPPAGACATTPPQTTAFAARIASPRPLELPLARMRHHICKNQLPHNAPPCSPASRHNRKEKSSFSSYINKQP